MRASLRKARLISSAVAVRPHAQGLVVILKGDSHEMQLAWFPSGLDHSQDDLAAGMAAFTEFLTAGCIR